MSKNLDTIVDQIEELPTLQQVAVRLLQIIDNPTSTVQDVNRVVTQDPALASKILKLVNSAYLGLQTKVSDLQRAITLLGFNMIKGMALSVSVFDCFADQEGDERFRREFWMHSIACANLCREVGSKVRDVDAEVAFVLGLLHDIGKLVLDIYAHDEWHQIMTAVRADAKTTFFTAERQILDTDHAELGGWLAKAWGLNEDLVRGIRGHHRESMWKANSLGCTLFFCNRVARLVQEGDVRDVTSDMQLRKVTGLLRIKTKEVIQLGQMAREELRKSAVFLDEMGG